MSKWERFEAAIENGLRAITSKRMWIVATILYLATRGISDVKFSALCAVAIAYIASETFKK